MPKYRVTRGKIGRLEDGTLRQYGPGLMDTDPATGKERDMSIIEMDKVQASRYMSQLEEMPGQYEPTTANVEVEEREVPAGAKVQTGQLEAVKAGDAKVETTSTTPGTTATTDKTGTTSSNTGTGWNGDLATISEHTAPDVISYMQSTKDPATVQRVLDAEKSGRNRKGVIAAGEDKLSSFK